MHTHDTSQHSRRLPSLVSPQDLSLKVALPDLEFHGMG